MTTRIIPQLTCLILAYLVCTRCIIAADAPGKPDVPATKPAEPTTKASDIPVPLTGATLTLHLFHGKGTARSIAIVVGGKDAEFLTIEKDKNHSELRDLPTVLKEFKKRHDNGVVVIRGDQDLTYSDLEPVLIKVAEAGITDTNYEVAHPPGK